jgi:Tfp pilus assembly protein PilF
MDALLAVLSLWTFGAASLQAATEPGARRNQGELLSREGQVEYSSQQTNWASAVVGQGLFVGDRLRTFPLSRAMVRLAELGQLRVNERTTLELLPPLEASSQGTLDLKAGAIYFFTRGKPREILIRTPHATGASRGTEWLAVVEPGGRSVLTVFDGEVEISNPLGTILLRPGEQGTVDPGQAPVKTAVLQIQNIVQWWLYYPDILDLAELPMAPADMAALNASLAAYRSGELLRALQEYPVGRSPTSASEQVYYAGLLLAVGQVEQAQRQLAGLTNANPTAKALERLLTVVTRRAEGSPAEVRTADYEVRSPAERTGSEWLAESFVRQARFELHAAREAARAAVQRSPEFGFGWARLAELEFSFGETARAKRALERALELAPRHAEALALRGFVLAGARKMHQAELSFGEAMAVDGALGNAWLGRGLCRLHRGDAVGGRRDLQTAAALEPNRSLLRSYLGKAFDHVHDRLHATQELELARKLDPADPTPWLYSALLLHDQHRNQEAIGELEQSLELNDNRRVYRSRLLLDQDRATRGAGLATVYRDADLSEVSLREAAHAVSADYANYAAHLFLANSYDALRDPTRFNLRYETAWFNELLLANLLAPVGAGTFSQNISQQEYTRLFEQDRLGLVSTTDLRTDGQYRERASQFGTMDRFTYSLDVDWQHNDGVRRNNELDRLEWYTQLKYQLTERDTFFVLAKYQDYESGDNFQYYSPTNLRPHFSFSEQQAPTVLGALHREWAPGVHTIVMGGRLANEQEVADRDVGVLVRSTNSSGQVVMTSSPFDVEYQSDFEIFTTEASQLFQRQQFTTLLGVRGQFGDFTTGNVMTNTAFPAFFQEVDTNRVEDFRRLDVYGYETWEIFDALWLTAGLAYEQMVFPSNHRQVPISGGTDEREHVGPKGALVWVPDKSVAVRGFYAESLGGVSFDESYRLEPVQLAGFSQAYRTLIPESVAGSVSAPLFTTFGGALDVKLRDHAYLGLEGQSLGSEVRRDLGIFVNDNVTAAAPSTTPQHLDYSEQDIALTLNQLIGTEWSLGARYQFSHSELRTSFPGVPNSPPPAAPLNRTEEADLHRVQLRLLYTHASGLFGGVESTWYKQINRGYTPELPGDALVQVDLQLGWRLPRQRGEIRLGLLNITEQDYHLNPLNVYAELPRERVLAAQLRLRF